MTRYFDTTLIRKLALKQNTPNEIHFNSKIEIDENGKISNVEIFTGSGYKDIDNLFIETLKKMPNWNSAINEQGSKCKDKQLLPLNIKMSDYLQ